MRRIDRIDKFCDILKEIWKKYPDIRLGQLMYGKLKNDSLAIALDRLWSIEDDELLKTLLPIPVDSKLEKEVNEIIKKIEAVQIFKEKDLRQNGQN